MAPSTVAMPLTFAIDARLRRIFISIRSWSPGAHGLAELRAIDTGQQHQFALAVGNAAQHQDARHLRHGFDDQDAGHYRIIREMAREERLVHGHVLDADDAFGLQFLDAVHQKERIAVRQDFADGVNVQGAGGNGSGHTDSEL